MSTYMPNAQSIERKWYILDAAGKPLGRTAVKAANLLRGKYKPLFVPHVDCGDHVIVINCEKAVLTGKKLTQKYHYHHTGYIGHLKSIRYDELMRKNPARAMQLAVKGMLQGNSLGRKQIVRLRAVVGNEHKHEAQKPEMWKDVEGSK